MELGIFCSVQSRLYVYSHLAPRLCSGWFFSDSTNSNGSSSENVADPAKLTYNLKNMKSLETILNKLIVYNHRIFQENKRNRIFRQAPSIHYLYKLKTSDLAESSSLTAFLEANMKLPPIFNLKDFGSKAAYSGLNWISLEHYCVKMIQSLSYTVTYITSSCG